MTFPDRRQNDLAWRGGRWPLGSRHYCHFPCCSSAVHIAKAPPPPEPMLCNCSVAPVLPKPQVADCGAEWGEPLQLPNAIEATAPWA